MRVFILSDIHGSVPCFEAAMAAFDREGAELLVLGGDYLNHGPRNPLPEGYAPDKLAPLLNARKGRILGVRGNCDSEVDQMLLEFPALADYALLWLGGRKVFVTHGHLHSPDSLPPLNAGDVFVSGHTHVPLLETRGGVACVNPGSPTLPKGGSAKGYAVLDETGIELKTLDGTVLKALRF